MKKNTPIKHFLNIGIGVTLSLIIGLLTTPIITRLVDPIQYGQLSIFNLYANFSVMVFCVGLDQALVRFYYQNDSIEYKRDIVRKCWMLPILCWIFFACAFLSLYRLGIFEFEFNLVITIILAICIAIQIMSRMATLVLRLEMHSAKYSIVNILSKISYAVSVIALVKLVKRDYLLILTICTTFSSLVTLVISVFLEKQIWVKHKSLSKDGIVLIELKTLLKYGFPFIFSMGITTIFNGIDKLSLNYFCSYSDVGIYASAMSLINIFAILQTSFNALWAPMATEHYEKNREDKVFYQKGNAYITILMFVAGLCLIFAKDLFVLLLGEKYREAGYILPALCFSPIMYTISETTVSGINFAKKSWLHILTAGVACITNFVSNCILVPFFAGRGAAISTGLSYIVFFSMRTYLSNKYFFVDFKLKKFYTVTGLVFVYALYNTFTKFNVLTICGFVGCFICIVLMYRNEMKEGITYGISYFKVTLEKLKGNKKGKYICN